MRVEAFTNDEELLPIKDVARLVPRFGPKAIHYSTVWRWCIKGMHGIRLEHVRVGGRICTTRRALDAFIQRVAHERLKELDRSDHVQGALPRENHHQSLVDAEKLLDREGL